MDHFIPTEFTVSARDRVIWLPLAGRESDPTVVPVRASNPLVEVGRIEAGPGGAGTALPCVNWAGKALQGFNVTLLAPIQFKTATLASGGKITVSNRTLVFDLAVTADVIILR